MVLLYSNKNEALKVQLLEIAIVAATQVKLLEEKH
jgi:hypothetical protein